MKEAKENRVKQIFFPNQSIFIELLLCEIHFNTVPASKVQCLFKGNLAEELCI